MHTYHIFEIRDKTSDECKRKAAFIPLQNKAACAAKADLGLKTSMLKNVLRTSVFSVVRAEQFLIVIQIHCSPIQIVGKIRLHWWSFNLVKIRLVHVLNH